MIKPAPLLPLVCSLGFVFGCESKAAPEAPAPNAPVEPLAQAAEARSSAAAEPKAPATAEPAASLHGEVDLVFSGGLNATLKGPGVTCGKLIDGPSFKVRSSDFGVEPNFEFSILGKRADWEGKGAAAVLNVLAPQRSSWGRNLVRPTAGDSVQLAPDDSGLKLELTLKPVGMGQEPIQVRGMLRCQD